MLALALLLAQVFTVDDDGPADFDDIPPALAAAQPGDAILVAAGSYSRFDLDKALRLIGAGADFVTVAPAGSTVTGIAAGEQAVVAGMVFQGVAAGGEQPTLTLADSAGAIVLQGVRVGPTVSHNDAATLVVAHVELALLQNCTLSGGGGGYTFYSPAGAGLPALQATSSKVHAVDCQIGGGEGHVVSGGPDVPACDAALLIDASLSLQHSWVHGGQSSGDADAGDGIDARQGSEVRILGGPVGHVWGGTGGNGVAVRLELSSALAQADVPVYSFLGAPAYEIGPGSEVVIVEPVVPVLTASPAAAAPGATFVLMPFAEPDGLLVVAYAQELGPALELPGILSPLVLDLASLKPLAALVLDAGGYGFVPVAVPALAELAGATAAFQAFQAEPALYAFSNPCVVRVL